MNLNLKTTQPESANKHKCECIINGDWVEFKCPKCVGYKRMFNVVTGENKQIGISSIAHFGNTERVIN